MKYVGVALLSLAFVSCGTEAPLAMICPTASNFAVVVIVVDAQTGAFAPFADVRAVAQSGAHRDSAYSAAITDDDVRAGRAGMGFALGRPGTFDVTVSAAGYQPWSASRFTTTNNLKCQYQSDTLVARLRRL